MRVLDQRFRRSLEAARERTAQAVARLYRDSIDPDDIPGSFRSFEQAAAPVLEAGQSAAQALTRAYLEELSGRAIRELDEAIGVTRAGKSLAEGLDPFSSMMLGDIANGAPPEEAIAYGETLVTGFADREVTAASDLETERLVDEDPTAWRWIGVVQPGSCERCQENEGEHRASDPIYRHNNCACDRIWQFVVEEKPREQLAPDEPLPPDLAAELTELVSTGANAAGMNRDGYELLLASGLEPAAAMRASGYGTSWNFSTSSYSTRVLMQAAAEHRGLDDHLGVLAGLKASPEDLQDARALLAANEAAIAARFGTTGRVTLYRGLRFDDVPPAGWTDGGRARVRQNPLSSWTPDRDVAAEYASSADDVGAGVVLEAEVPVSQIAGLPKLGLGNANHSEVVLYGDDLEVTTVWAR